MRNPIERGGTRDALDQVFEQGSLSLFRVRGVPIRAHWTLLLILPYLALVLSIQFRSVADLAGVAKEQLLLPPLVWGAVLAIGLFASITLHELAHTFAAIKFGGSVRSITLMLVGGVSQLARAPRRPYQEAIMAAVGPLTSLALGGLFLFAYAHASASPVDLRMGLFYLAAANLTLGVFNLVPAFPMDGGRLLRAALALTLSRERATRIAASVGKVCAIVLGVLGLWSANILLMLIAVFVYSGAQGEVMQERIRGALEGLRVVDLLPNLRRPPPLIASDDLLANVLPCHEHMTYGEAAREITHGECRARTCRHCGEIAGLGCQRERCDPARRRSERRVRHCDRSIR